MSSVIKLNLLGQSIWYDNVSRSLIENDTFKGMIERREIYGVTSNPSIFQSAIAETNDYNTDLQTMAIAGLSSEEIFYQLAIQDIKNVADLFRPYYDASSGADGFVSLEVNPNLAQDTQGTIKEAMWLWEQVDRPNLMVKIPATKAGLPAITEVIAAGINVNVTLIFSLQRYEEVMQAYLTGLEKRLENGKDISRVASVASFFVSRLESKADKRLQEIINKGNEEVEIARSLKGKLAVDNTRLAYQAYEQFIDSTSFKKVAKSGAQTQRPLWASTSTKDPDYSDIKYVEELVAENSINTVPPETLNAFLDHGDPELTIYAELDRAKKDFQKLTDLGISIDEITQELEDEGVQKFADSFNSLIETIDTQRQQILTGFEKVLGTVKSVVNDFKREEVIERIFRSDPTIWAESAQGKEIIQKRLAWLYLPSASQLLIPSLCKFVQDCKNDGLEKVLLLGMGGSSLAPETINLMLGEQVEGLSLLVLDSTIPGQVRAAEEWVDYRKTLFIVASKSGTTTETLSLFHYFWDKSKSQLDENPGSHFVAITDPGSELAALGNSLGFRKVFTANTNVGGRYSALSLFGLVPAALVGIDISKFLNLADAAVQDCLPSRSIETNLGAIFGILMGVSASNGMDKLTFLSDPTLSPIGPWLEQLVAESSGKQGRGIVPVVDEPLIDAASYRNDRLFVYFRMTGDLDLFVDDLQKQGQMVFIVKMPEFYHLAEQLFLWEFAVAVACSVMGVNAFDQPDVQDSKDRTKEKIGYFIEKRYLEESPLLWEKGGVRIYGSDFDKLEECKTLSEVVENFVDLAEIGDYVAINAYLPRNDKNFQKLQKLREYILNRTGNATTLGFGPRFLHSTGQLHKGGANNGLFIQITQEDEADLEIAGLDYSFGVLARAQALGDLDALMNRGRRVIRIHLPAEDGLDF